MTADELGNVEEFINNFLVFSVRNLEERLSIISPERTGAESK
jgi:hypothetical protein